MRRGTKTRVLIAFEDEYRSYREFMASAVRMHRPSVEVMAAGLGGLGEKVTRFDPHLVICSRPNTIDLGGRPAWVELPPNPNKLAEICIDGQQSETSNPALEDLLSVLDETERLARTKRQLGDC
jgi:hypothetical protein